ncbi:ABC transporter-like protein [Salinarchaeum sp. Harcht-Bsk1]|uniref:ABC transporter ATP-binding protein n=1 Tax=Salinarchaeum sp. Harcht-Bsk1 TaxID=1333523 RepID=UPI00034227B6|nr:ABC transporter ATP-binding protein [Salinarchaeum sp. Harcht-Bsk1]AGN01026.1 ABC transporter-like protein [Salinarchaeum sp. Harcht-Bsk1]
MAAIRTEDLTKRYGDVVGIEDVSLTVEEGEVFGYLGPNGAGKTTTIRALLGFITPTSGSGEVLGADISDPTALREARADVGFLPSVMGFPEEVTGRRYLDHQARILGDERRDELLELFDPPLDRAIEEYSTGNLRMLGIVRAFMHDPDLVILDEPTSGLDPLKQSHFNAFVRGEVADGTTVFFSSHVLGEVRQVCDRVGILRGGRLVTVEPVDELLHRGGKRVRVVTDEPDRVGAGLDGAVERTVHDGEVQFTYAGDYQALLHHLAALDSVQDVEIAEPPLEDVFLHFYGEENEIGAEAATVADPAPAGTATGTEGDDV